MLFFPKWGQAQRGYISATRDVGQVSSLLVQTDEFLAIFLFWSFQVNPSLATHCTEREALNLRCRMESPKWLLETVAVGLAAVESGSVG